MNFTGYKTSELKTAVDLDVYAVRDEAYRRSEKLQKQLARAKAQVAKLQAEHDECGNALLAVSRELAREARDDQRSAAVESYWQGKQGEEYGSY